MATMDSTNHEHCTKCFKMQCDHSSCPLTSCDKGCGFRMHLCKISDHGLTCPKTRVCCPNVVYGCPASMLKETVKNHLKGCPASVVFCTMEWRRYPVFSKHRLNWVPFFQPNPVLVKGDLDVELAIRDQRVVEEIARQRMRKGKMKVDVERRRLNDVSASAQQRDIARDKSRPDTKGRSDVNKIALARSEKRHFLKERRTFEITTAGNEMAQCGPSADCCDNDDEYVRYGKRLPLSDCNINNAKGEESIVSKPSFVTSESSPENWTDNEKSFRSPDEETEALPPPPPPDCVPMYLDRPLGLNVMIESLPKFIKQEPMYTIPCNQVFRRDEFSHHSRNVHNDIHGSLNGWLQHRCPLAQYGCNFVSYRLRPHGNSQKLLFSQELGSFGVRRHDELTPENETSTHDACDKPSEGQHPEKTSDQDNKPSDLLTAYLPIEILMNIVSRLDAFSLRNFSCTCKRLRDVCRDVVTKRGMVLLDWEQVVREHGKMGWRVKRKVRRRTTFLKLRRSVLKELESLYSTAAQLKHPVRIPLQL